MTISLCLPQADASPPHSVILSEHFSNGPKTSTGKLLPNSPVLLFPVAHLGTASGVSALSRLS